MKTKKTLILTTTCGLLAVLLTQPAKAQTINPSVIDPTSTYAGKTYSEWSAAFWQYYMSLPATNNPFVYNPAYPVSPLSTGQSGPVWFFGGNYLGGTHAYTNTIPGGTALFGGITDIEQDNAACPVTNNFSEAVLRATAKNDEDQATTMSCTIDGVAVKGLTNVLTTPYRVHSTVFNYICPAVHNVLHDLFGDSCYQNNNGTPYTIRGAVEDGVFLLIAPLSVGQHVIHTISAFPSFQPPFAGNSANYLTVLPVALTVNASAQPGNLILSWPQTPDNYTVQTSPSLSPPDWQPANLVVTTNNGILQVTAPVGATNQFFRLQLN
jgi:hypothetical protein